MLALGGDHRGDTRRSLGLPTGGVNGRPDVIAGSPIRMGVAMPAPPYVVFRGGARVAAAGGRGTVERTGIEVRHYAIAALSGAHGCCAADRDRAGCSTAHSFQTIR